MKNLIPCLLFLLFPLFASAQADHPSLASKVFATHQPAAPATQDAASYAGAGTIFLAALSAERRAEAALAFDSPEKSKWTNVPPRGPQGGVRLGDLNEAEMKAACEFLRAVMGERGYLLARNIPLADDTLLRNGRARPGFGAENYWLAIFGTPSAKTPWAVQFDGHHLAINLRFKGDDVCLSPSFIGTQPRAFDLAAGKVVPMDSEIDLAYDFIESLDDELRGNVVIGDSRGRIRAAAGRDGVVPEPIGAKVSELSKTQTENLFAIIQTYVDHLPPPAAKKRMAALRKEADQMHVAWSGPIKRGSDISYHIQSPSLLIEYAGQNLGGDPLNHIHAMYRDPTNEYGLGDSE